MKAKSLKEFGVNERRMFPIPIREDELWDFYDEWVRRRWEPYDDMFELYDGFVIMKNEEDMNWYVVGWIEDELTDVNLETFAQVDSLEDGKRYIDKYL